MNNKTKTIIYDLDVHVDNLEREMALSLFDMLEYKQNIVLYAFRAYNDPKILKSFTEVVSCRTILDVTRNDCFCLFIPVLQSNLQLIELISKMDVLTEWIYIPSVTNFDELLFNWKTIRDKGSVRCGFSLFEAVFDANARILYRFDADYFVSYKINDTLQNWEKTFDNRKFKKKLYKTR